MNDWGANLEINARFETKEHLIDEWETGLYDPDEGLDDEFDHLIDEGQMIWSKSDDYTYWRQ